MANEMITVKLTAEDTSISIGLDDIANKIITMKLASRDKSISGVIKVSAK